MVRWWTCVRWKEMQCGPQVRESVHPHDKVQRQGEAEGRQPDVRWRRAETHWINGNKKNAGKVNAVPRGCPGVCWSFRSQPWRGGCAYAPQLNQGCPGLSQAPVHQQSRGVRGSYMSETGGVKAGGAAGHSGQASWDPSSSCSHHSLTTAAGWRKQVTGNTHPICGISFVFYQ